MLRSDRIKFVGDAFPVAIVGLQWERARLWLLSPAVVVPCFIASAQTRLKLGTRDRVVPASLTKTSLNYFASTAFTLRLKTSIALRSIL
jgi:hypothetical protein